MGRRVERTRAGNTWTESRYFSFIRGLLRGGFRKYPVKHQVKVAARRVKKGSRRFEYPCNDCKGWFPDSQIDVDHIQPAGSLRTFDDLPGFVSRLYCEAEGMQLLCKACHQKKTNAERKLRSKKK